LWHARHKLYYASLALRPGCRSVITDVCVPISRLPEMIEITRKDFNEAGIEGESSLMTFLKLKSSILSSLFTREHLTDEVSVSPFN
jgi:FAD/FMN-containing dehydrogenase